MGMFLSIVVQSLVYPFREIAGLIVPYLITLLLLMILLTGLQYLYFAIILEAMISNGWSVMDFVLHYQWAYESVSLILWGLVVLPLYVAVSRSIVINDKFEPLVLNGLLKSRTYKVAFAWIKVLLIFSIPIVVFTYIAGLVFGSEMAEPLFSIGSLVVAKGHLLVYLGYLLGLYYMVRGSMATVTAAVDEGFSIRNSFRVTRGHALQVFFSVFVLFIVLGLLGGLLAYIASTFGFGSDPEALIAMSTQEKLMLSLGSTAMRLLSSIIFVAALAKIYVAITAKS